MVIPMFFNSNFTHIIFSLNNYSLWYKTTHKTAHFQIAQATSRTKFAKELFFQPSHRKREII